MGDHYLYAVAERLAIRFRVEDSTRASVALNFRNRGRSKRRTPRYRICDRLWGRALAAESRQG